MNIGLSLVYENEVCPCFIKEGHTSFLKEGHTFLSFRSHKRGTDLVLKPHAFLSFGKSPIPAKEGKKQMPKLSARVN